jgi:hypothetical protein
MEAGEAVDMALQKCRATRSGQQGPLHRPGAEWRSYVSVVCPSPAASRIIAEHIARGKKHGGDALQKVCARLRRWRSPSARANKPWNLVGHFHHAMGVAEGELKNSSLVVRAEVMPGWNSKQPAHAPSDAPGHAHNHSDASSREPNQRQQDRPVQLRPVFIQESETEGILNAGRKPEGNCRPCEPSADAEDVHSH